MKSYPTSVEIVSGHLAAGVKAMARCPDEIGGRPLEACRYGILRIIICGRRAFACPDAPASAPAPRRAWVDGSMPEALRRDQGTMGFSRLLEQGDLFGMAIRHHSSAEILIDSQASEQRGEFGLIVKRAQMLLEP